MYLLPSLILQAVYGDSYGFLSGEDCWIPDGQGGWQSHGFPDHPEPAEPSINVSIFLELVPFLLPLLLIFLYLLSPLSSFMDREPKYEISQFEAEKYYPDFNSEDSD